MLKKKQHFLTVTKKKFLKIKVKVIKSIYFERICSCDAYPISTF